MAPLYQIICDELGVQVDSSQLAAMKEHNATRLKEIDAEIEDAENNLGTSFFTGVTFADGAAR